MSHLQKLATHTTTEYFDTGTRIIAKDEFGDKFYVIRQGCVRCSNIGPQDPKRSSASPPGSYKPHHLDLESGSHFGERALIHDEMRACDVIALKPTSCHVISRNDFITMLGPLVEAMERSLALRVSSCTAPISSSDVFYKDSTGHYVNHIYFQ